MFLFLMRHGTALFDDQEKTRVLTDSGKKEIFQLMTFSQKIFSCDFDIWHSPLKRAVQTADLVQRALKIKTTLQEIKELSPEFSEHFIHLLLEQQSKNLMLITHMPLIHFLFSSLIFSKKSSVNENFLPFSCGTFVALEKTNTMWILRAVVSPEMIA